MLFLKVAFYICWQQEMDNKVADLEQAKIKAVEEKDKEWEEKLQQQDQDWQEKWASKVSGIWVCVIFVKL